jgi:phosphoglycerol transferase MdoB-like AlkP superfamily enzyme
MAKNRSLLTFLPRRPGRVEFAGVRAAVPYNVAPMRIPTGNRRLIPLGICWGLYLAAFSLLRIVLVVLYATPEERGLKSLGLVFLTGLRFDVAATAWILLPMLLWLSLLPERLYRSRVHRVALAAVFILAWSAQVFFLFTEYYFFDEFKVRFNGVAVEYLIYPHEVLNNIRDSYPVAPIVALCLATGIGLFLLVRSRWARAWSEPVPWRARVTSLGLIAAAMAAVTLSLSLERARFSRDRVLNELAGNGPYSFVHAAYTHYLDFPAFYLTLPRREAYLRARHLLGEPGKTFRPAESIQRHVDGDPRRPRRNVVIFLEESFGSEFWGALGRPGASLTPAMDALSREGLLFTHLYASGNRTVRGMEGVLSSFPPLPGNSIVRRDLSDHVETLARLLKRDGYDTVFLYGGRGVFDGMKGFALANGFDRFVEQKDFPHPVFSTIWGVSDEDLFQRAIGEFHRLHGTGRPFFATVLSVSNHKPFTYPAGRIPEDPQRRRREHAVRYADWALGQFFRQVRKEPFFGDTIFIVVADHGARVYGSLRIPVHSYEIPMLVVGPGIGPGRIGTLGCSLDVAPTVLGLIGRPYETVFFGRDLLRDPPRNARALIHHDLDIGILEGDTLAVLQPNKTAEFYHLDPVSHQFLPDASGASGNLQVQDDAIALFEVADDLYTAGRYFVVPPPAPPSSALRR